MTAAAAIIERLSIVRQSTTITSSSNSSNSNDHDPQLLNWKVFKKRRLSSSAYSSNEGKT
ncbi:hypothetical protein BLOT_016090 [Blomia tropicalis]|nr:hypothetical protein BLOT_016090 [Blomia tropicalis]